MIPGKGLVVVHSWVEGHMIVRTAPTRRLTQDDVLAYALYLSLHGKPLEADEYLADYIRRQTTIQH